MLSSRLIFFNFYGAKGNPKWKQTRICGVNSENQHAQIKSDSNSIRRGITPKCGIDGVTWLQFPQLSTYINPYKTSHSPGDVRWSIISLSAMKRIKENERQNQQGEKKTSTLWRKVITTPKEFLAFDESFNLGMNTDGIDEILGISWWNFANKARKRLLIGQEVMKLISPNEGLPRVAHSSWDKILIIP